MDRETLVTKLVRGEHLYPEERKTLGPHVHREELASAIARELERYRRFPMVDATEQGGLQLVVLPTGVRVVSHRVSDRTISLFPTAREAIEHYIELEIGPSCGGVPVTQR